MSLDVFQKVQVVGVEDGSFQKGKTRKTLLAVVLLRGLEIKSVKITKVTVDGVDATEKLASILKEWNFDAVMLAGVSFAGFNLIDPTILLNEFKKPVIILSRVKPNNKAVKRALQHHFEDWQVRWNIFKKLGPIHRVAISPKTSPLYVEAIGTDVDWASCLIRASLVYGKFPEPIRVARLIARGLSTP